LVSPEEVEAVSVTATTRGDVMYDPMTVSDVARALSDQLGVNVGPRDISDLFYKRFLHDDLCPIVGGRRLIPRSYLPEILDVLRARGAIPDRPGEEH
jgi:hypothetical protein